MSSNKKTLIDGDFQVGSSHFYVDVENNRVGLNQANPASSLDVNGNAFIATDMTVASNVTVGSNVIAQKFTGSASGLTSVPADQISGVIPVANGGTGTTATTGTGSLVKSDNPTFTGTVTADTFSGSGASLTNIPMGQATGTLAVANGGTGVTTSTGTGNTVLSASPTLTGTVTAETGNFSSNVSASNIYAGHDTDMTSYLGRAAVGFSGISDEATFAHVDVNSTNNYALKQTATGGTYVNSATSKSTIFSINDSEQARINVTGLGVGTNDPLHKLDVHGTANVGALTCTTISGDGYLLSNVSGYSWPTHINGNDIYYTTGNVGIGTATPGNTLEVAGTASVAILKSATDAATSTYNFILNGPRPGTTSGGASHFINGSTRTEDGGVSTYTIRNNSGALRLGNASYNTLIDGVNVSLRVMSGHETEGTLKFSRVDGTDRVHNIKVYNSSTQNDNYMKFQIHAGGSGTGTLTDNVLYLRGDGNVGIGKTDPGSALDVNGTVTATSFSGIQAGDVPSLDASKISSGTFLAARFNITDILNNTSVSASASTGTVGVNVTNATNGVNLAFTIPPGAAGTNGTNGVTPTIDVGATTTGAAGTDASVSSSTSGTTTTFSFTIPKGDKGDKGDQGDPADINGLSTITTAVGGKVRLGNDVVTNTTQGLYFHSSSDYSIARTSGSWSSPNYQQLKLTWGTGIVLDPGTSYDKSYVDVLGRLVVRASSEGVSDNGYEWLECKNDATWGRFAQTARTNGIACYNGIAINTGGGLVVGSWDSPNALGVGNGKFTGTLTASTINCYNADDNGVAQISAYGSNQGTGRLYVGQSGSYGGGIEYNGDNSPASTGAGADYITLYRVNNGTYAWTARNLYSDNNWEFRGEVYANAGWFRTYGDRGWYNQSYGGGWFMQDTTYVRCYNNKTVYTGGSFLAGGNVTAYSDIRRKKDLLKIDNALDKVEQLTGYTYTNKKDNKRYTGLIAQDVEKVLPEAVTTESDGHLSLAYGNMMGLLVEAVKELTRKNEILEARLSVIENNK
jgi:hypothetical protein